MDSVLLDSVEGDRQGLVALFLACGGRHWRRKENWLLDRPIGEWDGVQTNDEGRLVVLRLHSNNLTGSLPQEIGNWTQVEHVYLQRNNLTGRLPREIGNWGELRCVSFSVNNLTGSLPQEIGNWRQVQNVLLHNNNLSGSLPKEIENWRQLIKMGYENNLFTGRPICGIRGYRRFYTCHIRRWVLRERRRFLFSLI